MQTGETTKVLAIVQAGGAGGRMDVLTAERAKPALPFAGSYQLLDFPLSNLVNSGVDDVWLSVQYQATALEEQVLNGRPWDLDRTRGGLRLLVPQEGQGSPDEEGFAAGNADELFRLRDQLRDADPDVVLVLSADHVYRLDFRDVVRRHREKEAELTLVVHDLAGVVGEDPGDHGVVQVNRLGRVTDFAYKPEEPDGSVVATEVFCYDPAVLVEVLEQLHGELDGSGEDGEDSGIGDFGDHLVPRMVERGRVFAHELEGYWRDLGQPHHYLNAHLELLTHDTELFVGGWPVRTRQPERVPALVEAGAEVADSLLSPGCRVGGRVERSVIGPDVVVERGAVVTESVLLEKTVVRAGARVARAIVDSGCELRDGAVVGSPETDLTDPDAIALVGRDSVVSGEQPAGSRLPPGTTD